MSLDVEQRSSTRNQTLNTVKKDTFVQKKSLNFFSDGRSQTEASLVVTLLLEIKTKLHFYSQNFCAYL